MIRLLSLGAFALWAMAAQSSQSPAPTLGKAVQRPQQESQPKGGDPGNANQSDRPSVAAAVSNPANTPQAQQPAIGSSNQQKDTSPWWLDPNVVIAALTFVLAVIAGLQWWASHVANRHTVVTERGYVHVPEITTFKGYAPDSRAEIGLTVTNHGNTPATITGIGCALVVVLNDHDVPRPMPSVDLRPVDFVVVKDKPTEWGSTLNEPTQEQWQAAFHGTARLVLFGVVEYDDVFRNKHRSEFGFAYREYSFKEMSNGIPGTERSTGTWVIVPGYNKWS